MVNLGRIDLFCRGASEVKDEYDRHKHLDNFSYDQSKLFYYPFPHFFYTHKSNTLAIKRIQTGLLKALKNGILDSFWEDRVGHNARFIKLEKRQLITLENPMISNLSQDFEQYYHPIFSNFLNKHSKTKPIPRQNRIQWNIERIDSKLHDFIQAWGYDG